MGLIIKNLKANNIIILSSGNTTFFFFLNMVCFNIDKTKICGDRSERVYIKIRRDYNVHKINSMLSTSCLRESDIKCLTTMLFQVKLKIILNVNYN